MKTDKALDAIESAIDRAFIAGRKDAVNLAEKIVEILDVKARRGRRDPSFEGWENGEGVEYGSKLEKLIQEAKDFLNKNK